MVSRGRRAVLGTNGAPISCRARVPESCSRVMEGINGMQFIFKENSPKRTTKMGKGIPAELEGAGGTLKLQQ